MAAAFHLLGIIYSGISIEKSNGYFKEEIRISEEIGADENLVSNINIGAGFLKSGKLNSAMIYSFRAFAYADKTGEKAYQDYLLMVIGNIYLQRKLIDSAKYYYRYSMEVNKEHNNLIVLSYVNIAFAELYKTTG